jgi:uncharacterized protein YbaP (TraB family)
VGGVAMSIGLWLLPAAAPAQPAAACPPPPDLSVVARTRPGEGADHGLLWRAEKEGRALWLYGTLHVARPEWIVPGPRVLAAIGASDTIALEIDITDTAALKAALQQLQAAAAPPVPDAARSARIAALVARTCAPAAIVHGMPLSMQVVTLGMLQARHLGLYPELAIDMVLAGVARGAGKRLAALETAAQQLALLAPGAADEEAAYVDEALDALESGKSDAMMQRLAAGWERGDEQMLLDYPQWCECMATEAQRKQMARLLDGRNAAMADRLAQLHAEGRQVFAGVGALHLPGPQGVAALLRARGFTVRRVPFDN